MKLWQGLSQSNSELIQQQDELSIYNGPLTTPCVIQNMKMIKYAFPALPEGFYEVLSQRIKEQKFSDERLTDAVNYVIDNCVYPTPTIAQFISFDKKFKVLSYEDMVNKTNDFGAEIWNSYKCVSLPGRTKKVWIHIDDIITYKLPFTNRNEENKKNAV
jgi:hypothetical protein